MSKDSGSSAKIVAFFKKNKLGQLVDLFNLLNTQSRMSVFRHLKKLNYLSSYTHAGSYYTLQNIPDFKLTDLWFFNDVGFSKFGSLKETVRNFVECAEIGCTHEELENKLRVRVYNTLLDLFNSNSLSRIKIDGEYVYFSIKESKSKKQILGRQKYSMQLKNAGLSDWVIIEILASIIRMNNEIIEPFRIISDLSINRNLNITENQIDQVLQKFALKKTPEVL